jgi:3-methyladenine DNA glycosylase AlkD
MSRRSSSPALDRRLRELRRQLVSAASDSQIDLRAYLGSPLPVLGVPSASLDAIARGVTRERPELGGAELRRLAGALWRGSTYDERALAINLLGRNWKLLDDSSWKMMDRWVDEATGWGLCDSLAGGPIAWRVAAEPFRLREIVRWARASNPWRRRAALYSLNRLVRSGKLTGPLRVIDVLREDPEFWVQRAVGTWLRECWKQDEGRIREYLSRHAARLPPVALTVATERAPAAFRARLREVARKARRRSSRA